MKFRETDLPSQSPETSKNLIKDNWNFFISALINKNPLEKWINQMHSSSTLDNYRKFQTSNS